MHMTNKTFIEKYGKYEFRFLKDSVHLKLFNYKSKGIIEGFRLNKRKNFAHVYLKNNEHIKLEFGTICGISENEFIKLIQGRKQCKEHHV